MNNKKTNLERLQMEVKNYNVPDDELIIYLEENDLVATDEYNSGSNTNKKQIYKTALEVLESVASDPNLMKNYKTEDISITHFHTNLMNKIDDLRKKIATMVDDEFQSENDVKIVPFIW